MLWNVNQEFTIRVPIRGGTLSEGVIGIPRFINPVLAINAASHDVARLVYAGLMKKTPSGEVVPDLAESYEVSEDGRVYTFTLLPQIVFHDGVAVTARDVVYTIGQFQDPAIKSPRRAVWLGLTAEAVSDTVVRITLRQPYPEFLPLMSVGILPQHLWGSLTVTEFVFSTLNTQPIGAGPYKIVSISVNNSGVPNSYVLTRFKDYQREQPLIASIALHFFADETLALEALRSGNIDSLGALSPVGAQGLPSNYRVIEGQLPRIFSLFFNHNQARIFLNPEVKQALQLATDISSIITAVFDGHALSINSPVPTEIASPQAPITDRILQATALLEKAGWVRGVDSIYERKRETDTERLVFNITTSDTNELKQTAELLKQQWQAIGVAVEIRVYGSGDLNQNIIPKRNYDALLFGHIITRPSDLYAFWHSSQRTDPGLNVAQYTNAKVDTALEALRTGIFTTTTSEQIAIITREFAKDIPALFLYSPFYVYAIPESLGGVSLGPISEPADRFATVNGWYRESDRLWTVFAKKEYQKLP